MPSTQRLTRDQLKEMNFEVLPVKQFLSALTADPEERCKLIVATKAYHDSVVGFYTADGSLVVVDQNRLGNPSTNKEPNFDNTRPIDYGLSVVFGNFYELSSDTILSRANVTWQQ